MFKSKFDNSNLKTIATVTNILGKYGYQLDSTGSRLLKIIKDSSKTNVILPENPTLVCSSIEYYGLTKGIPTYKINFESREASSSGYNIKCYLIAQDSLNKYSILNDSNLLEDYDRIPKNSTKIYYHTIYNDTVYRMIFLRLFGTYRNSDQSKTLSIDEIYYGRFYKLIF